MPNRRAHRQPRLKPGWVLAAGLAALLLLVGDGLQQTADARPGASARDTSRTASPSTTRRPRSGAIRSSRNAPQRPTAAAAANVRAQASRAARPRAGSQSSTRRGSITRPRSQRGSISGRSSRAASRRSSVNSLTGGYRPADPAPIRNGGQGSPSARPRSNSSELRATIQLQGEQIADLNRQLGQLRESFALISGNVYRNSVMTNTTFQRTIVNESLIRGR